MRLVVKKMALLSERGFTLIEALFVVALVAVLAALAVPSFATLIANQRVASAAQELQALLLFARAEAVYKRSESSVSAAGLKWEAKTANQVLREATIPDAVTVESASSSVVIFETSGQVRSSPRGATYTVSISAANASRIQCLSVTRAGLVRLKSMSAAILRMNHWQRLVLPLSNESIVLFIVIPTGGDEPC